MNIKRMGFIVTFVVLVVCLVGVTADLISTQNMLKQEQVALEQQKAASDRALMSAANDITQQQMNNKASQELDIKLAGHLDEMSNVIDKLSTVDRGVFMWILTTAQSTPDGWATENDLLTTRNNDFDTLMQQYSTAHSAALQDIADWNTSLATTNAAHEAVAVQ